VLLAGTARSQFQVANSVLPGGSNNNSSTENADFADVDQDGDWDIILGDGGDDGNDQNRIWINQGNAQAGTIGNFEDRTSTQFPTVSDTTRDIEFVDFDNDSDQDIYVSNTSQNNNQGNRWFTNLGNAQAGTAGFYIDETNSRWSGLGGPGSSIAPSQLIGGNFIDWSCDCDFGDLDNDGDMDLVHTSYGGSFDGEVPTRVFLNDGNGVFSEFNPSGFQLSGPSINNGNPGLWCDGTQSSGTTNSNGTNCDIAMTSIDADVGDIDGDFDLDILHGARQELPRMFANRLDGSSIAPDNGGLLGFRDVTGLVFPPGYSVGTFGHYEQEMGDFDGDGDLDIYGLNWIFSGFSFNDITLRNNGDGTFGGQVTLSGSSADDNEGDFMDYDNDGDLDLYVANFSGQDKLYRNTGSGTLVLTSGIVPSFGATSLDADIADTDGDGDYDVLVSEDNFSANTFLRNTNNTPDTHPPYIPNCEEPRAISQAQPFGLRAHVYDNAPYYITYFNPTWVEINVSGCQLPDIPATSSGGQVFRAEVPANLDGNVILRWVSEDEHGNRGFSSYLSWMTSKINKAPGAPGSAPSRTLPIMATGSGSNTAPVLQPLTFAFGGAPYLMAARSETAGAPFVVVVTDTLAGAPIPLGADGLSTHLTGNLVTSQRGTIGEDGQTLVDLGTLPADLPVGTEAFAQLFVQGDGGWEASRVLRIVCN